MKKERKIDTKKSAIKKVVKSSSQGIKKQVMAKRERGITLIALVVTIIIMLILAAVTLNMALGNNGLIQMAKFATNKYEQAATNESLAMNELSKGLGGGSGSDPTTPTETPEGGGGGTPEGQLTAASLNKDNYGDYVDYGLDLNNDGNTTNDWRIFYVGDVPKNGGDGAEEGEETEKRVFLIAADYVPNECDALQEAQKKEKASMTPSTSEGWNVCSSYWSSSSTPSYHCNDKHNQLNSSQQQCSFPEVFMTNGDYCGSERHYYCSDHVGTDGKGGDINSRCASSLQCTGNWKPFVEQSSRGGCANYAIGGPTLEMWVASWNEKHGNGVEDGGKTLYADGTGDSNSGYYVGEQQECTSTYCSVNSTPGYNDTLYFPHKTKTGLDLFDQAKSTGPVAEGTPDESENASCNGYWLGSPSANATNYLMEVDYSGYVYHDSFNHYNRGVRPVVSLKSNVKLTKRYGTGERVVYDINT